MKSLKQPRKTVILSFLIALALAVGATTIVLPALAASGGGMTGPFIDTAGTGVTTEFIAGDATTGISFSEDIDVAVRSTTEKWGARIFTRGASHLYVVKNTFEPGGQTGWHTHPGPSMVAVTEGTITAYDGDDPTCTPHVYTAGTGLIDAGGDHVHLFRNETGLPAVTVATQLIPAGADRRNDAADPGNCPF